MLITREILEIGARYALKIDDFQLFESYFNRLRIFYFDYARYIESSPYMYEIIALHLMVLLSSSLIEEFLMVFFIFLS